jgi:hypothetical protein
MIAKIKAALAKVQAKLERLRAAAHRNQAKINWFVKRKTILRKKLKEAKAQAHPKFESWMTNGHSQNVTDAVKREIALGVVRYDLYVTSTSDGYPGDGRHAYTSLHYWQNNPDRKGHAVDMAGSRMTEFQNTRVRSPSHFQEFFGPNSANCVKNGVRIGITGDLAALHKTHDHDAPYIA